MRRLGEASPEISVEFRSFRTQIDETLLPERLVATLSGLFGLLAAVLATVGLYGVMSYTVARRRNEIGIRIALGADRGAVMGMILREAAGLLGIGLAIGAAMSLVVARAASALLFGVKPGDPGTLAGAAAILAAVALMASYVPARHAARLEPTSALREE